MKRLALLTVILLLAGCAPVLEPVGTQSRIDAEFQIKSWWPEEWGGTWRGAKGRYEMKNTGNVEIGYFEVYFEVTCEDDKRYRDSIWGPANSDDYYYGRVGRPVPPGMTYPRDYEKAEKEGIGPVLQTGAFFVKTHGSKPVDVRIYDWKIRRYY